MKASLPIALIALALAVLLIAPLAAPVTYAEDSQAVTKVDQAFTRAVTEGNRKAAAAFIDDQFEFTTAEGKTLDKSQTLDQLSLITTADPGVTDVRTFNYGEVGDVFGIHEDTRFLRVWVKRTAGWRIFNYIETPIAARAPLPPGGGDCINPCKTIPYTPTTEMDKAILDAWQHAKNDEWHPNSADWALRVSDEFLIINARTARPKSERVAILAKQQAAGTPGPPGDPIHDIRMFDFGDRAAVMLSRHTPYHGGKPYYNVRVWILRGGRWQLAVSQQTTIQSAAPVPAVN
ncbi:MAG: nuclear transport factor 2 family protein [Candidatus Acidiferrales bacterium]